MDGSVVNLFMGNTGVSESLVNVRLQALNRDSVAPYTQETWISDFGPNPKHNMKEKQNNVGN